MVVVETECPVRNRRIEQMTNFCVGVALSQGIEINEALIRKHCFICENALWNDAVETDTMTRLQVYNDDLTYKHRFLKKQKLFADYMRSEIIKH